MRWDDVVTAIWYHWAHYVAAGGYNAPTSEVGELTPAGQLHWFKFLLLGKQFLLDYPEKESIIALIVPKATMRLLRGE